MGLVFVHLSDEEKLEVLLVAIFLFLVALIVSLCLAVSCCPLNKWLIERHSKRRRLQYQQRRQQPPAAGSLHSHGRYGAGNMIMGSHFYSGPAHGYSSFANKAASATLSSYSGPPPAYEAALRATRLQRLTSSPPPLVDANGKPIDGIEWLKQQQQQQRVLSLCIPEKQIDFGDYFHQPREPEPGSVHIPIVSSIADHDKSRGASRQPPPVMLRLWVRMMEPGELVARARKARHATSGAGVGGPESRRMSLSRQLSIPQFFGSLVTLASGSKSATSQQTADGETGEQEPEQRPVVDQSQGQPASIVSTSSSSNDEQEAAAKQEPADAPPVVAPSPEATEVARSESEEVAKQAECVASHKPLRTISAPTGQQLRALSANGSITSRVLHMNVASFSYVKDESLISTKKHNQMNFHHFCGSVLSSSLRPSGKQARKSCQLMISICDVENLLNSCWLQERASALLAPSSSVYVQCEILTSKGSKSARILGYPLRALNTTLNLEPSDAKTHTVNFASNIPAAAVERSPNIGAFGPALVASGSAPVASHPPHASDSSLASDSSSLTTSSGADQTAPSSASTNWRHEPSADGKSIVVFSSVPKQMSQSQQQSGGVNMFAAGNHQGTSMSDLIQFDSVFVSPILSKSIIEDGFVRFRFYSQCKYVNETCLAELKLPLRQLLQRETRDNLGDAIISGQPASQSVMQLQQAELILDNLLSNLVTASTGSPLSALIEQISAEEREERSDSLSIDRQSSPSSSFRLPWTLSVPYNTGDIQQQQSIRTSSSLSNSLNKLSVFAPATGITHKDLDDLSEEKRRQIEFEEHERQIEKNYCRSLLVSHWLNYLAAPAYECQVVEEPRGKVILGLTYLPTSNRVIFNAHRASIDNNSYSMGSCGGSSGKQMMKNLRLQSSTCYLLRFLMVANGRVLKKRQTPATRKLEWDSQEPITFDLVSVSVEQPSFMVALVVRNSSNGTGSLQNLQNCCNCLTGGYAQSTNQRARDHQVHSEPESLEHYGQARAHAASDNVNRQHAPTCPMSINFGNRDLVVGHLVLGEEIWREMRAQPRKQIVRQFKIY